jgi:predicted nucleotidyltransferase
MTETSEKFVRPATLDDLKKLVRLFNEAHIEYLLIGGYALFAHGYQRTTTDIDFIFPPRAEVGVLVKQALMSLPDKVAAEIDPAWFEEGENIRVADQFLVDIMFNACGQTYDSLSRMSQTTEIDGIEIKTISLEGLLLTKQTVREKDIQDRLILERALIELGKISDDNL